MKKILLLSGLLLLLFTLKAQENDSTSNGNNPNVKEIVIKLNLDLSNLQNGLKDFETKINDRQSEINALSDSLKRIAKTNLNDTGLVAQKLDSINLVIEIDEDIISALEKGMEDINNSIEDINDQLADLQDENFYIEQEDKGNDHKHSKNNKFKGHWAGLNLGLNNFVGQNFNIDMPSDAGYMYVDQPKSWEFSINPVQLSIPFFNKYLGAVTGVGFTFNNYELKGNYRLFVDSNNVVGFENFGTNYTKNRFKTSNVTVPLLIEIQIPINSKNKRLFLSGGVIGSYSMQTKVKYLYNENGSSVTYKDKTSNWPVNYFNYAYTVRIGYDDMYAYANYTVLPVFLNNKGPQINNFSAGLGLRF